MLRRRMFLILGSLVALMVAMGVAAIVLLQNVLGELDHINADDAPLVEITNRLNEEVSRIEMELYQLRLGQQRHLDELVDLVMHLRQGALELGGHEVMEQEATVPLYRELLKELPVFEEHVSALATAQDQSLAAAHNRAANAAAIDLRTQLLHLGRLTQDHAQARQLALGTHLRWLVVGLSIGFLLLLNVSIVLLLRIAAMILKPVDELVAASRELAKGNFAYRVRLGGAGAPGRGEGLPEQDAQGRRREPGGPGEFNELAQAYNQLAEQLQADEQHRLETLGQAGLTLNHELNNAIATIELQVHLLAQRSKDDPAMAKSVRLIQDKLQQMAHTVALLKQIRRVVLTDYVAGQKMLDLQLSTQADSAAEPVTVADRPTST